MPEKQTDRRDWIQPLVLGGLIIFQIWAITATQERSLLWDLTMSSAVIFVLIFMAAPLASLLPYTGAKTPAEITEDGEDYRRRWYLMTQFAMFAVTLIAFFTGYLFSNIEMELARANVFFSEYSFLIPLLTLLLLVALLINHLNKLARAGQGRAREFFNQLGDLEDDVTQRTIVILSIVYLVMMLVMMGYQLFAG